MLTKHPDRQHLCFKCFDHYLKWPQRMAQKNLDNSLKDKNVLKKETK